MAISDPDRPGLLLEGLTKRFGGVLAVDHFSLAVRLGEVMGLVGPNGSGKTTLLNLITGVVKADAGEVWTDGRKLRESSVHSTARAGVVRLFQEPRVFNSLTVAESLAVADGLAVPRSGLRQHIRELVREFSRTRYTRPEMLGQVTLESVESSTAEQLSFGQKRLLGLAAVVATGAKVLLLDEPTAGLSPAFVPLVAQLLRRWVANGERLIVVVEHNLAFLQQCSDRCVVMHSGRNVAVGDPTEILQPEVIRTFYLRGS